MKPDLIQSGSIQRAAAPPAPAPAPAPPGVPQPRGSSGPPDTSLGIWEWDPSIHPSLRPQGQGSRARSPVLSKGHQNFFSLLEGRWHLHQSLSPALLREVLDKLHKKGFVVLNFGRRRKLQQLSPFGTCPGSPSQPSPCHMPGCHLLLSGTPQTRPDPASSAGGSPRVTPVCAPCCARTHPQSPGNTGGTPSPTNPSGETGAARPRRPARAPQRRYLRRNGKARSVPGMEKDEQCRESQRSRRRGRITWGSARCRGEPDLVPGKKSRCPLR